MIVGDALGLFKNNWSTGDLSGQVWAIYKGRLVKRAAAMSLYTPQVYHFLQSACGFFQARVAALHEFAPMRAGDRVLDIGCGPGNIVEHLREGIEYHGFDIDQPSIDYAKRHFGQKGSFYCKNFTDERAADFKNVRAVMFNGVLHHLSDDEAFEVLTSAKTCLRADGYVFTLDGCLRPDQKGLHRWLHEHDRGKFVRNEIGYKKILSRVFSKVNLQVRDGMCRLPHTLAISVCQ